MRHLRPSFVLACFALLTLPLMPVQQLFVWFWPAMAKRFPMRYHRLVCRLLGIRLTIEGEPPTDGPTDLCEVIVGRSLNGARIPFSTQMTGGGGGASKVIGLTRWGVCS